MLDSAPENIPVHIKIRMNEAISHPDDTIPRNLGRCDPTLLGQLSRCLADNLYCLDKGEFKYTITVQIFSRPVFRK